MSYRITMDGQPFCSSNVEHSAVLDPSVSLEVNKAGKLTFTILPDHPMYDQIALRQSMFDVYQNDELIFEGIATQEDTDFYNRKVISCEGELTFLNDSIQRQAKYTDQSVQSLLGAYLTVHNEQVDSDRQFSLGSVTVSEGNGILRYTNFQNTMKEIGEDLIDNYGGYLRIRHQDGSRYLDYLADPPRTSSQVIRLGKNLIDYSSNLSSLNIITCLIPRGAKIEGEEDVEGLEKRLDIKSVNSGKDYLVGTAAAWYGNVWGTQTWDGVTTASALKAKGEEYLEDAQWSNLVISASAIDLGLMEEDVEQFRLLDMIRVVSEPHGIDRLFLLSKLDINLDHPAETKITLGKDTKLSLSARSAKNSTEIQSVETRILPSASENAKQILDSSTDGNIYFRFDDQTGKLYEIDIMDTNDPNTAQRIWRWNIGGWGYSNDGGQTYITAATMDGAILASMITTGILKSDDGTTFYLDLDNGVLKGNFSELSIAGSSGATQSYADGKASAAQSAAISAAASDATSKANAAQSNAISAAARNTSSAISEYDDQLGQNAVFNKLTNNGQTQGIFLQDGKVYINGDYIQVNDLFTRNITASNFNITGGSININTNNQTLDYIRLNHTKSSTYIASNMFAVENKATADNPYLKTTMQGGGLFLSNTNTNKTLASLVTTTGSGVLLLYDANEVLRIRLATNGAQVYDSNGNARVLLSDSALNLYSASNSAIPLMRLDDGGLRFNDSSSSSGTSLSSYNSTDAYIRNSSGKNIILLNSTGAGNGSITLRDGTNNRVILNDGGLYFYDSGGTQRLRVNPAASGQITITPTVVATW